MLIFPNRVVTVTKYALQKNSQNKNENIFVDNIVFKTFVQNHFFQILIGSVIKDSVIQESHEIVIITPNSKLTAFQILIGKVAE